MSYPFGIKRCGIYEFYEADGTYKGKKCLIVSNSDRDEDNIVSILIISNTTRPGRDVVEIPVSTTETAYVRCGLITYCKRMRIGTKLYEIDDVDMGRVTHQMAIELGVKDRRDSDIDYKSLYEDLLGTVASLL